MILSFTHACREVSGTKWFSILACFSLLLCASTAAQAQNFTISEVSTDEALSAPIAFLKNPAHKGIFCYEALSFEQPEAKSLTSEVVSTTFFDDIDINDCGAGTVTRTWTAKDAHGNTCQAQQIITIAPDTEQPSITLPFTQAKVDAKGNLPTVQPVLSDNCTPKDELVLTHRDQCQDQTIKRTYTVRDACGNTASAVLLIELLGR